MITKSRLIAPALPLIYAKPSCLPSRMLGFRLGGSGRELGSESAEWKLDN